MSGTTGNVETDTQLLSEATDGQAAGSYTLQRIRNIIASETAHINSAISVGITAVAASGANQTLTLPAVGDIAYDLTLTANCTLTLSGGTAGKLGTITAIVRQDATAGRSLSLPAAVAWPSQIVPTFNLAAGKYDVLQFATIDGGSTWIGSLIASAVQPFTAPLPPVSVAVAPASGQNILYATDGGNGGSAITGHNIYRGASAGTETLLTSGATLPYTDSSLTNGTAYYYTVAAVNAIGTGTQSAEVLGTPSHYLNIATTGAVNTPHLAGMSPGTSTIDIRVLVNMASWIPAANAFLMNLWSSTAANAEYGLYLDVSGHLNGAWYTSGATFNGSPSTVALPFAANATMWVRALITPSAGTCAYYTSPDGSTWTQLGATITGKATTAVQTPGTPVALTIGQTGSGTGQWTGRVYQAQLLIGGTQVVGFNLVNTAANSTTFTGSNSETWTVVSAAAVV